MSTTVGIRMLRTPQVFLDDVPVCFPFRKAEALIYYLAVKKTVSREEIASLLWPDAAQPAALKNLRHAVYTCKKICQLPLVLPEKNRNLTLNPEYNYQIDYDTFRENPDLSLYQGEFLQNFYLRGAPEFEFWAEQERSGIRRQYLELLLQAMESAAEEDVYRAEEFFTRYTLVEPFDERIHGMMLKIYNDKGMYQKGIRLYQDLSRLLTQELAVSPSRELKLQYEVLLRGLQDQMPSGLPDQEQKKAFALPEERKTGTVLSQRILSLEQFSIEQFDLFPLVPKDLSEGRNSQIFSGTDFYNTVLELEDKLSSLYPGDPDALDFPQLEARLLLAKCRFLLFEQVQKEIKSSTPLQALEYLISYSSYPAQHPEFLARVLLQKILFLIRGGLLSETEEVLTDLENCCKTHNLGILLCASFRLHSLICFMKAEDKAYPLYLYKARALVRGSLLYRSTPAARPSLCRHFLSFIYQPSGQEYQEAYNLLCT